MQLTFFCNFIEYNHGKAVKWEFRIIFCFHRKISANTNI